MGVYEALYEASSESFYSNNFFNFKQQTRSLHTLRQLYTPPKCLRLEDAEWYTLQLFICFIYSTVVSHVHKYSDINVYSSSLSFTTWLIYTSKYCTPSFIQHLVTMVAYHARHTRSRSCHAHSRAYRAQPRSTAARFPSVLAGYTVLDPADESRT